MTDEMKIIKTEDVTGLLKHAVSEGATVTGVSDSLGCELCSEQEELRPFGPNGEWVCFPCGMKSGEAAEAGFNKVHNPTNTPQTP